MTRYTDIARLWAEQAPKGPKVAGNFWRAEREAGHHRSCVARLIEAPNKKLVALIWDSHWGTGTAAMLNSCEAEAVKAGYQIFRVPDISEKPNHIENLSWYLAKVKECEGKIANARTVDWRAEAERFREKSLLYIKTFKLDSLVA